MHIWYWGGGDLGLVGRQLRIEMRPLAGGAERTFGLASRWASSRYGVDLKVWRSNLGHPYCVLHCQLLGGAE